MTRLELELDDAALERLAELVAERLYGRAPEAWVGAQRRLQHLACKRQRIYDLVSQGAIPHRKDGTRLLFRLSELDEWLETARAGPIQ